MKIFVEYLICEELMREKQLRSLAIWKELNNCIVGGANKLHMLHFTNKKSSL